MNGYREENPYCYFHPSEAVVGVCPLCLNERLLILASRKVHHHHHHHHHHHSSATKARGSDRAQNVMQKKPSISFPKIFAFSSFLNRLEFLPWKSDFSDHDVSTSQEDSFISIKFKDNGVASWEKNTVSKVALENCNNMSWNHSFNKETNKETKTVIEHGKPRASSLRWRKRIGHLFQLIRWKRTNKGNVCHVSSKVEGVKVRKGWIRNLTKKRTME